MPPAPPLRACTIKGTAGDDRLIGTAKRDVICGLGGDDLIIGGRGDILVGGPGDDHFAALNKVTNLIYGGPGFDVAIVDGFDRASGVERRAS